MAKYKCLQDKEIVCYRAPDKSVYWKTIFFISHPKHMLWVLKRTISILKKSLSGPMMLLYVSYVYHMISAIIKVVVSAFEIYVADVISRQHIGDKKY